MQERNFERQVRKKMEELSITPSEPVWQKVEAQIKAKKDKRRIVFWLLPLLATGLFFGWWLWPTTSNITTPKTAINKPYTSQKTNTHTENITAQPPISPNSQTDNITTNKKTDSSYKIATASEDNKQLKTIIAGKERYATSASHIAIVTNYPQQTDDMAFTETNKLVVDQNISTEANVALNRPVALLHIPVTDSIVQQKPFDSITISDAPLIMATNKIAKKWQWSIYGSAGISGISNDLLEAFSFNKSTEALQYASAPGYSNYYPLLQVRMATPAPVTEGFSFSAGVDLKKAISKKAYIATGLHYAYYSTQTEVGQKISNPVFNSSNLLDASAGYRNTSQRYPYTNQYHFIEVPVSIYYQLLKRRPLHIHTGIIAAQLLSSNALYYDAASNAYYQNKNRLNKTQLNWQAGISYDFAIGKHISLTTGPQIQYGLRTLQNTTAAKKPHLFAAGMRMNISVK